MSLNPTTPWHQASYDQFLNDSLPQLLAARLPLAGYQVIEAGEQACAIHLSLNGGTQAVYTPIPRPDEAGLFYLSGEPCVVIPTASQENLEAAEIACVGEQLLAFIQERLGQASNGITWNEEVLRTWLPLERWIDEFLQTSAQRLDTTNWLSRHTHLRRILIPERLSVAHAVIAPGQLGRVCPYETPEGPNIGKVFTVAVGAEIRLSKLVIVDHSPAATLGLSASMLPFLEHNDPNRLLMAANMQRQSLPTSEPEPALVQTGFEPSGAAGFWCGHNLLTALASLGEATTEDGIVISESAARRMLSPVPVEVGDKIGNRHGIKGVITQILPDDEMPRLPADTPGTGTPVELVYSFAGFPVRAVFGPALEIAWGRVAHAEEQPVIAAAFAAPSAEDLRLRLKAAGLPEDGQETLTLGKGGPACELPSTVGWMYWTRLAQRAGDKLAASAQESVGLAFGELEFQALKTAGAVENIREAFLTRSARRSGIEQLADQLAAGEVETPPGRTIWFSELTHRLQVAGIQAELSEGKLSFHFAPPPGETLRLAQPMSHPWLHESLIDTVGAWEGEAYTALMEANQRLERMLASHAPAKLVQTASQSLADALAAYYNSLLPAESMSLGDQVFLADEPGFGEAQVFSGKAVAAPGTGLRIDQVGLPDEIAWTLFSPLVSRKLGAGSTSAEHSPAAAHALDEIMAQAWVIVHRAPVASPTGLLAFHPVRNPERAGHPDRVIRVHPLACAPLNTDFDGDQLAVYLPVTAVAQQEAGEKMTLAAHLKRDPALAKMMWYQVDLLWGLAWLSLKPAGREAIAQALNTDPARPFSARPSSALLPEQASLDGPLTQETLQRLLGELLEQIGPEATLDRMQTLAALGFRAVRSAGASYSPFFTSHLRLPPIPESDDPERWWPYMEEAAEAILAGTDFTDPTFGPQLLSAKTRERSRLRLPMLVARRGLALDADDRLRVIRHTQIEGMLPEEAFAAVAGARRAFAEILLKSESTPVISGSWNVLARTRRSRHPGIVFARAAASGEVDPLENPDSQLRVGGI